MGQRTNLILRLIPFSPRKKPRNSPAVLLILGILAATDFLDQRRTALEKDNQQQRPDHTPVDDAHAGSDGEQIEANPDSLLGKVVGMTAASPQAHVVEAFTIRGGQHFHSLDSFTNDKSKLFIHYFCTLNKKLFFSVVTLAC